LIFFDKPGYLGSTLGTFQGILSGLKGGEIGGMFWMVDMSHTRAFLKQGRGKIGLYNIVPNQSRIDRSTRKITPLFSL